MQHRARKRFGQNFLHDPGIIARIVGAISPQPDDCMVEIGPGQGAITLRLLEALRHLHAVELDRDLIGPLTAAAGDHGALTLHQADALAFDFRSLAPSPQALRVVGNLPYNISTPILFHLLDQLGAIRDMHFMLQKEVVARMAAPPGSRTFGRLSVMVQVACKVQNLFDIGPGAFRPAPKVDSAFVRLTPLAAPPAIHHREGFEQLVAAAFSQRRKTLRNSLKKIATEEQIRAADIDLTIRPERLSPLDFVRLANHLFLQGQGD